MYSVEYVRFETIFKINQHDGLKSQNLLLKDVEMRFKPILKEYAFGIGDALPKGWSTNT